MYTRCPECQTAFRVTLAQLKACDGLVRCGRCDSVFRADLRLFAPATGKRRGARDTDTEITVTFDDTEETPRARRSGAPDARDIPVVTDLSLFQAPRRGIPTVAWAFGTLIVATLLLGQFAYFYRHELAQVSELRPHLARFCQLADCELARPVHDLLPELVETRMAPHPRYANALRLRASLANRSNQPQPLPLMEVSLTDNNGQLLARRTFTPRDYIAPPVDSSTSIAPNVVVDTLLDLTDPDGRAAGFEVHLFPQPSSAHAN